MHLIIITDDTGTVQRLQVQHRTASGQVLTYEHADQVATPDGKADAVVVRPVPPEVNAAIAWALGVEKATKVVQVERTLGELAGVSPDKLAEVLAAIEKAKK